MPKSAIIPKPKVLQIGTATSKQELLAEERVRAGAAEVYKLRTELKSYDRKHTPREWAEAQCRLGEALFISGRTQIYWHPIEAEQNFREAVTTFREALDERAAALTPSDQAEIKNWIGLALEQLAEISFSKLRVDARHVFEEAIQAFKEALTARSPASEWEDTLANLTRTLTRLGTLYWVPSAFEEAVACHRTLYDAMRERPSGPPTSERYVNFEAERALLESSPIRATVASGSVGGSELVQDKRIITRDGVRFVPLSLAAREAQTSESAIRKWIANRVKFDGRLIETHKSITQDLYVSEDFVKKMANRFVKWPSKKPARNVTLGETDDQSGYLSLPDAARILHIGHHTIWLWVTQDKAPTGNPLDVIKCTISDYFYLREKSIADLKTNIPRSGLRRGPRSRQVAQPSA